MPEEDATEIDGVWRRRFNRGLVLVNPSEEDVGVALGERLTDRELGAVESVVLAAGSGRVLVR